MSQTSARDRTITRRVLEGEPCRYVGLSYGLSPTRVNQIVLETARRLAGWYDRPLLDWPPWLFSLKAWRAWYRVTPSAFEEPREVPHDVPHLIP